ncbi:MAG: response regulator [Alphaproteobacteria bacterium]|nr:response regulator [Alphaproteobacteria bacterium]
MVKILIVEDDADLRSTMATVVRTKGYEPVLPRTSAEALSLISSTAYDVVVTDVVMPGVDGPQIIRAVRKAQPACPILAISGGAERMPADVGLKLAEAFGADEILYKPFTGAELTGTISSLIGSKR